MGTGHGVRILVPDGRYSGESRVPDGRRWTRLARSARDAGSVPPRRWIRRLQRIVDGGRAGGHVHLTSSPAAWYAARAGGVVAYVLLTTVVLLGLQMSARRRLPRWPRI